MTKISKKSLKYYKNEIITLDHYFSEFHNFPKGSFIKFTHKDVKNNFPFIKTVRLSGITREEIFTGKVLLVKDCEGSIIPYINPITYSNVEKHIDECKANDKVEITFTASESTEEFDISEDDLESLSIYELKNLLKLYKDNNKLKNFRMVKKELYFNSDTHDNRELKKEKIRKREIRKDDLL